MRTRLARLLRRRAAEPPAGASRDARDARPTPNDVPAAAAREARIAASRARAWAHRLGERARSEGARTAIVAALLATEQAAALHESRAGAVGRSGGRPPLLH